MNDYSRKRVNWLSYTLYVELFILLAGIDQFTKSLITKSFADAQIKPVINGFFSLMYVKNKGSAFSLFANQKWGVTVLTVISSIALVVILFLAFFVLAKFQSRRLCTCLIFLAAGTLGNLIDRIRLHYVVDFLRFDFGSYTFPIFNVADICVTVSCIVLAVLLFFSDRFIPEIPFGSSNKEEDKDD